MKTFFAIIFCLTVAPFGGIRVVMSFNFPTPTFESQVSKTICCPPDQFSGRLISINTTVNSKGTTVTQSEYTFSVDFAKQIQAVNGTIRGLPTGDLKIHFIMTMNATYDIDNEKKTCTLNPHVHYTGKRCLTDDVLVKRGEILFADLSADVYSATSDGQGFFVTVDYFCTPVNLVETRSSPEETTSGSLIFTGVYNQADDSAFKIPSYCPLQ